MRYDYKCTICETIFEEVHSINETHESLNLSCPVCTSTHIKRYLGNYRKPTIIFKGSGWLVNDSALDAIGMPKNIRDNPATKRQLKNI